MLHASSHVDVHDQRDDADDGRADRQRDGPGFPDRRREDAQVARHVPVVLLADGALVAAATRARAEDLVRLEQVAVVDEVCAVRP